MTLAELVGRRVELYLVEPTSYPPEKELSRGKIVKIIHPRNALGHAYDLALVSLDEPFEWRGEIYSKGRAGERIRSSVVSIMSQNTVDRLEDLLAGKNPLVHLSLEDPRIFDIDPDDPLFAKMHLPHVGWASARLA